MTKTHYSDHIGTREDKHYKATLFQGQHMMLGLNCLEPGQEQKVHAHADQDKVYIVQEGQGMFTVGDESIEGSSGDIIFAEASVPHGVKNAGDVRLVIIVGMSPPPK